MFKVKDWMSSPVQALSDNDSLYTARELMDRLSIRHVPITDAQGNFIGLVTHRDMLSATISQLAELDPETQREIDSGIPLREIMATNTLTVSPDEPIKDAAQVLLNNKYGCMPVVEGAQLIGILTEADFLKLTIALMDALSELQDQ